VNGKVIMYADKMTESMNAAIAETDRRRRVQEAYNVEHGITPSSIVKAIDSAWTSVYERDYARIPSVQEDPEPYLSQADIESRIARLSREMRAAAGNLEFEAAGALRDQIRRLRARSLGVDDPELLNPVQGGTAG
jgi:excinuclease ABC subunit B